MTLLVKRIRVYAIVFLLFAGVSRLNAQESMMPDVSLSYLNQLIDTAYKYYPRQKALEHRYLSIKETWKRNRVSWLDPFTFSYVYSPNNSTTIVNPGLLNGYQFGIFFNIGNLMGKPANLRQAKEDMEVAKYDRETFLYNLVAEVKVRYYRYISQRTQLKLRIAAANDADILAKQSKYKFDKGEDNFENYNRILLAYNDRRLTVIQSEAEMYIAKSYLEEMVGKRLEEINYIEPK